MIIILLLADVAFSKHAVHYSISKMRFKTSLLLLLILHAAPYRAWTLMDSEQNYISPKVSDNLQEEPKNTGKNEMGTCPNAYPRYPYIFGIKPREQSFQFKCKLSTLHQNTFSNVDESRNQPDDILQNSQKHITEQEDSLTNNLNVNTNIKPTEARENQIHKTGDKPDDVISSQTHLPKKETNPQDVVKGGSDRVDKTQIDKEEDKHNVVKVVPNDEATSKVQKDIGAKSYVDVFEGLSKPTETNKTQESNLSADSSVKTGGPIETDVLLKVQDASNNSQKKALDSIDEGQKEDVSLDVRSKARHESDKPTTKQKEGNDTKPEEFASFRQWTQLQEERKREEERKKKEEERRKHVEQPQPKIDSPNIREINPQSVSLRMKKNFASTDCGAKVIAANVESDGSGNIITASKDEYMLNKCTNKGWFVVELCESIKAHKIEMASFQLFSSVFKNIRISLGSVFPGNDKVWSLFGEFEAEELRELQTFENANGVFGKYVKVEILSHHGTETICPISLFKIYGISEIELIDNDDDDQVPTPQISNDGEINKPPESNDVITIIQRKVGETIENLKGVFTAQDQVRDSLEYNLMINESLSFGTTFKYHIICPGCDTERHEETRLLVSEDFQDLLQTLKNPSLRFELTNQICSSFGFELKSRLQATCLGDQLVEFFKVLFGTSRIIALCNVIAWQEGLLEEVKAPPAPEISKALPHNQVKEYIRPSIIIQAVNPTKSDTVSRETISSSIQITQSSNSQSIINTQPNITEDTKEGMFNKDENSNIGESVVNSNPNIVPTPVTKDKVDVSTIKMESNVQGKEKAYEIHPKGNVPNM